MEGGERESEKKLERLGWWWRHDQFTSGFVKLYGYVRVSAQTEIVVHDVEWKHHNSIILVQVSLRAVIWRNVDVESTICELLTNMHAF